MPITTVRRIFLRNIAINMNIGVHAFEKQAPQRVIVNVDLYVSLKKTTPRADELTEVLDYDFVRETITDIVSKGHIQLQETLCDELVNRLLQHDLVLGARVSTEKPDVYDDCEGVGVEVFATRARAVPSSD
ncbi:dihydroneopterin aldolase [Orrella daihaiensis]|uniref:dihydroneopterin aldolase n=2 Tax=Orrella daihaiensis TaxID=2782176 RepID=A0ABY4AN18_9BURK|nr:dihydroneopterin aldolase [Orrella daihaiensis]